MVQLVLACLALAGCFWLMRRAARRFAEQQQRLGRWDAEGPLVETTPPPHSTMGGTMDERREIAGEWHGQIVRDRRPHKDSAPLGDSPSTDD